MVAGVAIVGVAAIGAVFVLANLFGGGTASNATSSPTMSAGPTGTPSPSIVADSPSPTADPGPTGLVAFSSRVDDAFAIVAAAPDGSGLTQLVGGSGNFYQPDWSGDGTRLAYASDDGIWVADADGGNAVRLSTGELDRKPEFAPDDATIAYATRDDGDFEIYLIPVGGGDRVRLTDNVADDYDPSWSAVTDRLAFVSTRDGTRDVWTMQTNGTDLVRLTGDEGEEEDPAWSPDGRTIAFASTRDGTYLLYLMNPDGTNIRRLTSGTAVEHDPTWSGDGRYIAFARAGDPTRIVVVEVATGTELSAIGEPSAAAAWPSWR